MLQENYLNKLKKEVEDTSLRITAGKLKVAHTTLHYWTHTDKVTDRAFRKIKRYYDRKQGEQQ